MNKPKIIFFDVDGTLVPLKGAARPRTLEALRRLHQNGIRVVLDGVFNHVGRGFWAFL